MKCIVKEDNYRVKEESRTLRVMIALKINEIFVPSILFIQFFCVVWFDEVVIFGCSKECRNEAFLHVIYWSQIKDVKVCFAFYC